MKKVKFSLKAKLIAASLCALTCLGSIAVPMTFSQNNIAFAESLNQNSKKAYDNLSLEEKQVYDKMLIFIQDIAKNGGLATFKFSVKASDVSNKVFVLNDVIHSLLEDCSFEFYWYDKTQGHRTLVTQNNQDENMYFEIEFYASKEYENGSKSMVKASPFYSRVLTEATRVVNDNKNLNDYDKLVSYISYILNAVTYENNVKDHYNDPYNIINVFDKDNSTNVVCEGYSKALKYLCDLSTFNKSLECYTVCGDYSNSSKTLVEPHMWNIIRYDNKSYHFDLTNSDNNTIGFPNKLIFKGNTNGNVDNGYSFTLNNTTIHYDYSFGSTMKGSGSTFPDYVSMLGRDVLTLSKTDLTKNMMISSTDTNQSETLLTPTTSTNNSTSSTNLIGKATNYGSLTLDTAEYNMSIKNIYDIGVYVCDAAGNRVHNDLVKKLFTDGKVKVTDSRTGSIVKLTQLDNGNFRVQGLKEGSCYIVYDFDGNHASVKINVVQGIKQGGTTVRNSSAFVTPLLAD